MKRKKIKQLFFYFVYPAIILPGFILLCSCTKKEPVVYNFATTTNTATNIDTMPVTGTIKYIALGDSYTIGTSVAEAESFPVQTAAILKSQGVHVHLEIIATNGWTTANLINAVKDKPATNDYDVVSLLIGVNNQYQGGSLEEYKQHFKLLLQKSIQLAKGNAGHVIVLSIPDYSVTPFASTSNKQKIAAEIDAFNAANKTITEEYKVHYLNVTEDSRKAAADLSLVAADNLHFSGKEYAIWAGKLAPIIKTALR